MTSWFPAAAQRLLLLLTLLLLALFLWPALAPAQPAPAPGTRTVAVTLDDLPMVGRPWMDPAGWLPRTDRLLAALAAHRVPAIGFVNEGKLYEDGHLDPDRVALLARWLDAGLTLGNHSFAHADLHRTALEDYQAGVLRGEAVTRRLLDERRQPLRFFRHPYLHTGRDLATKQAVEAFLRTHGYRVAPVTHDNSEWIFALAYDRADRDGDDGLKTRIADAYVPYMEAKFAYFERQTVELFGRAIPQVLLLHANTLNADHFGALAAMMQRRGYTFVTLDEALRDPAYASEDTYTGAGGITWLHRWALTRGVDRTFFQGEPLTPPFVLEAAGITSE